MGDNDYVFFHTTGAPLFFDAVHEAQKSLYLGTGGTDLLTAFGPNDFLDGKTGNDFFFLSASSGTLKGGAGKKDTLDLFRADSGARINFEKGFVKIDGEKTKIKGIEIVSATDFDDVVISDNEKRDIRTWLGDDLIDARSNDKVDAGDGKDTIVAFGSNIKIDAGADADTISAIGPNIRVQGGAGHDDITIISKNGVALGGGGKDVIVSSGVNTRIKGGAGEDSIEVTKGSATVSGGAGMDAFIFRQTEASVTIDDYEAGEEVRVFEIASGVTVQQQDDDVVISFFSGGKVTILDTTVAEVNLIEG